MIMRFYHVLNGFVNKMSKHHVGAFASQAAFFILLSIFPFISILLSLVKYTPITKDFIFSNINTFIPGILRPFTDTIVNELYSTGGSNTAMWLTLILAIWSSGKGIMSIIYGLNSIYEIDEKRNYFVIRIVSAFYTLLFLVAIIISLGLLVFGNTIYGMMEKPFPLVYDFLGIFISQKELLTFFVLILFFLIVYRIIPLKSYSLLSLLPGACISSVGWVGFSFFFSLYIKYSNSFSYTYGSLATIIIFMMWMYICMYILFIGAEINIYFNDLFSYIIARFRKYKAKRKAGRG